MTKIRFEEIKIKGNRTWRDGHGRKRRETKVFMQTINPFNLNKQGHIKSESEIMEELGAELQAWINEKEKPV